MSVKQQLCFIVNQRHDPPISVLTTRFEGETEEDVKRHLENAFATLPFETFYSYIIFNSPDGAAELLKETEVEEVVDYPGAKEVVLRLRATCKRDFYLPRAETGAFVDIEKQVQCLSVLVAPWEKKKKRWKDWLIAKKKELGIVD